MIEFVTKDALETKKVGLIIAEAAFSNGLILLTGDLGAGKTTLTGGIANGLGVNEKISSPTFNILKCYFKARIPLYHIDAYRLEEGTNKDIGLEEFIDGDGLCVIEWPSYINELIPNNYLSINIEHVEGNVRRFKIESKDNRWNKVISLLKEEFICTESF